MASPVFDLRAVLLGLLGMLLTLFLGARAGLAEPANLPDVASPPSAAATYGLDTSPTDLEPVLVVHPAAVEQARPELAELLFVRTGAMGLWKPQTDDEMLAIAVAAGNNPDLEPRNPFRKRSRDLFRTERPLTIGDTDMIVRLRLRAKAKRAVSVEVRF
jgi:hypothetical protein